MSLGDIDFTDSDSDDSLDALFPFSSGASTLLARASGDSAGATVEDAIVVDSSSDDEAEAEAVPAMRPPKRRRRDGGAGAIRTVGSASAGAESNDQGIVDLT